MIGKTIKNIKKNTLEDFGGDTYSKNIRKKILYKVLEGIVTGKIANIFFVFPMYKKTRCKNG